MEAITTVGLDIAKSVFQVHGVDAAGKVIVRRQLKRRHVLAFFQRLPACVVGIEACATSHHWSRKLRELGHTVRLMPPAYVKPYVKRQKNDAADAEAICEAVTRANMRFVETKAPEQQACLMLHRTRHLFIRQQTSVINAIHPGDAKFAGEMEISRARSIGRTVRGATAFRDGLLVLVKVAIPGRGCNIGELEMGKQLQDRNGELWICWEGKELKHGKFPHEYPLPVWLTGLISEYLADWRHILTDSPKRFLWGVGRGGGEGVLRSPIAQR